MFLLLIFSWCCRWRAASAKHTRSKKGWCWQVHPRQSRISYCFNNIVLNVEQGRITSPKQEHLWDFSSQSTDTKAISPWVERLVVFLVTWWQKPYLVCHLGNHSCPYLFHHPRIQAARKDRAQCYLSKQKSRNFSFTDKFIAVQLYFCMWLKQRWKNCYYRKILYNLTKR